MLGSLENSLANFFVTGKFEFGDFVDVVKMELAKLAARDVISGIGGLFLNSGGGSSAGGGSSIIAGIGSAVIKPLASAVTSFFGFADGGLVPGNGGPKSDSLLARLSSGEFVVQADAVKSLGMDRMNEINKGLLPGFADGGSASGGGENSAGPGGFGGIGSGSSGAGNGHGGHGGSGFVPGGVATAGSVFGTGTGTLGSGLFGTGSNADAAQSVDPTFGRLAIDPTTLSAAQLNAHVHSLPHDSQYQRDALAAQIDMQSEMVGWLPGVGKVAGIITAAMSKGLRSGMLSINSIDWGDGLGVIPGGPNSSGGSLAPGGGGGSYNGAGLFGGVDMAAGMQKMVGKNLAAKLGMTAKQGTSALENLFFGGSMLENGLHNAALQLIANGEGALASMETGGDRVFTQPSLVSVAENGPERISGRPLASGGGPSGGINIQFDGDVIFDDITADDFARKVAMKVESQQKRGLI
jgi:hypothetical protein